MIKQKIFASAILLLSLTNSQASQVNINFEQISNDTNLASSMMIESSVTKFATNRNFPTCMNYSLGDVLDIGSQQKRKVKTNSVTKVTNEIFKFSTSTKSSGFCKWKETSSVLRIDTSASKEIKNSNGVHVSLSTLGLVPTKGVSRTNFDVKCVLVEKSFESENTPGNIWDWAKVGNSEFKYNNIKCGFIDEQNPSNLVQSIAIPQDNNQDIDINVYLEL